MTSQPAMGKAETQAARASYDRVAGDPEFFRTFYRTFFERCPEVEPMFEHTDFERQYRLLRHAISLLIAYPSQIDEDPPLLERIAERHSRRELDVAPALYEPFVDNLIETLKRFDDDFDRKVEKAWRATLAPGIEYMKSCY